MHTHTDLRIERKGAMQQPSVRHRPTMPEAVRVVRIRRAGHVQAV